MLLNLFQGIKKPVRMLLIGGAYMMLLAHAPRTADDVDVCWVEEGEDFQKARLAMRDGVQAIANKYRLPPDWFNYLTQMLMYDKMIMPRGKVWRRYGSLHVYVPPTAFIFALKILAGRQKDIADCRILLPQTHICTRKQAQLVLDRSIVPDVQQDEAETIVYATPRLFGSGSEGEPETDTEHTRHWAAFCAAKCLLRQEKPATQYHRVQGGTWRTRKPVSYTNRKGLMYTLYRRQTKTGKPRYYFGRVGQGQGELVTELPPGFTIVRHLR